MRRFPLLSTYRILLIAMAALFVVCGLCLGVAALTGSTDTYWNANGPSQDLSTIERIGAFAIPVLCTLGYALGFLLVAEFIKLALNVESHLFDIRITLQNPAQASRAEGMNITSQTNTSYTRPKAGFSSQSSGYTNPVGNPNTSPDPIDYFGDQESNVEHARKNV